MTFFDVFQCGLDVILDPGIHIVLVHESCITFGDKMGYYTVCQCCLAGIGDTDQGNVFFDTHVSFDYRTAMTTFAETLVFAIEEHGRHNISSVRMLDVQQTILSRLEFYRKICNRSVFHP